jgi:purine-binding chemotaxis protein CheW
MTDAVSGDAPTEFITFRVAGQFFGIDIMCVREIRGWTPATALPHAPSYVRGVINLRGAVLPIVDLAARLGFGALEPHSRCVIIVAQIGRQMVGLLVDAVSDIVTRAQDDIQPTPEMTDSSTRTFVSGVFSIEDRMVGVITVGALALREQELAA